MTSASPRLCKVGNPGHTRGMGMWWDRTEEPCGTNGGCCVALVQGRIDEICLAMNFTKQVGWCMSLVQNLGSGGKMIKC